MAETVSIRRARAEDSKPVGELWLQLLREQAELEERFGPAEDAAERWKNDFREWVRDETCCIFVAEQDQQRVGFVTARPWTPPPIYAEANEVSVDELYVAPAARGQGIGRRLVQQVREWAAAREAERLRIGVLAANEQGRAFWKQQQARPLSVTFTIELENQRSPEQASDGNPLGF